MYNYIKGVIEDKQDNLVIIDNNGIGYEIHTSNNALEKLPNIGDVAKVLTYQVVKEDEISLYGFYSKEEKNMFLNLISVNGIGPKMAIGVLSSISLQDLEMAIISGDSKLIKKLKGIGPKTAERIVLELKDKIKTNSSFEMVNSNSNSKEMEDAISALEGLGLTRIDAVKRVREVSLQDDTAEIIIAKVLKGRSI